MRLRDSHLCYCTNIHPGETWAEIRANLGRYLPEVRRRVSPDAPMAVGLRLSALAAAELEDEGLRREFAGFLARESLYVCTLNGFPYGPFHGQPVKEAVYRPDWREDARLEYSNRLADLLAEWLPADAGPGSVSTVPGAFRAALGGAGELDAIVERLLRHVAHLVQIERRSGRRIVLALEPEPCCLLETVAETVAFFRAHLHSAGAAQRLAALAGLDEAQAAAALRAHLGVCLDLCHAAVEFEDAAACFAQLAEAGIVLAKLQVTAGLRVPRMDARAAHSLQALEDGVYLHQVVERDHDGLRRYADLAEALQAGRWRAQDCEWRVHFHVPVFLAQLADFASTQAFVREALELQRARGCAAQLEVETYTWSVLPDALRRMPVEEAIARELGWVREVLA